MAGNSYCIITGYCYYFDPTRQNRLSFPNITGRT